MGKKSRKEREDKRESFASQRSRQKRKNVLMASAVLGVVAVIVGISAYNFVNMQGAGPGAPEGAGALGDEHEHASILVRIHGDKFDFSAPAYQIKSSWIHFEGADGNTIHRHASGVTMGFLFDSLGLTVDDECFVFHDGRAFCNDDSSGYSIKFFINHERVDSIRDYVLSEDDRILVSFDDDNPDKIEEQLRELDNQLILK